MVPRLKSKPRQTKKTILFVGEGPTEKAFLQYIKELHITRDMNVVVKVECGAGGSPESVVERAVRLKGSRAYDACFVLIDQDRPYAPDTVLARRAKKKPPVNILLSTPCIEGLLLTILDHQGFSQNTATSDDCKRMLRDHYMPADKMTDKRSYVRLFSKERLNDRRACVAELGKILNAMEL